MFNLVVFINLKKAFDNTVNHGIPVKKLKSYGIKGQALDIDAESVKWINLCHQNVSLNVVYHKVLF